MHPPTDHYITYRLVSVQLRLCLLLSKATRDRWSACRSSSSHQTVLSVDPGSLTVLTFAAAIESFNLRPTITAFTCYTSSRGLDISTLRQLLAPFPALENLEMKLQVPKDPEDDWIGWTEAFHLYANLAVSEPALVFPPRLSEIQPLLTRQYGLHHLAGVRGQPPTVDGVDKRALRASMLRLYPGLKKMLIVVPTFVVPGIWSQHLQFVL
ncbi:hypothetical protein C8F01DRAFT_1083169 [Mycena amicta]|nr:hypothetical protein C8F01DRAFT_1083169 [Mycena amicta]